MVGRRIWLVGVDSDEEEQLEQPFAGHSFAANLSNFGGVDRALVAENLLWLVRAVADC